MAARVRKRRASKTLYVNGTEDSTIADYLTAIGGTFTRTGSNATFVGSDGLIQASVDGTPRLDYDPSDSSALGFLIEEARTNLYTVSEEFDAAAWSKVNSTTVAANVTTAPDGSVTADKMRRAAAATSFRIQRDSTIDTASAYTLSVFLKADEITWVRLLFTTGFPSSSFMNFDLTNGVTGTGGGGEDSSSIEDFGNGWFRCSITATSTGTVGRPWIQLAESDNDANFPAGNATDGIFLWGAQLEKGTFHTSYIKDNNTRAAEACEITYNNDGTDEPFKGWNTIIGSMYVEGVWKDDETVAYPVLMQDADNDTNESNRFYVWTDGDMAYNTTTASTSNELRAVTALSVGDTFKIAAVWKANNTAMSINGAAVVTDNTVVIPVTTRMFIGDNSSGTRQWNSTIKRLSYFNFDMIDADLITIST